MRKTIEYEFEKTIHIKKCLILCGDSRIKLKSMSECVDLIITSPPYANARAKQYDSVDPNHFANWFASFHSMLWNVLKPQGSLIINLKDKVIDGARHRFVWETIEKLSSLGWFCIDDYIWCKKNSMPGYWPTRLRDGWEYCFHLAKCKRPFINQNAVRVPIGAWAKTRLQRLGKNDLKRKNSTTQSGFGGNKSKWVGKELVLPTNVLSIAPIQSNKGHPAVFPIELPAFFIKLLSPVKGVVLDPFGGSGSTGVAAAQLERTCILVDIKQEYGELSYERMLRETHLTSSQVFIEKNRTE